MLVSGGANLKGPMVQVNIPKNPLVCPKKGIIPIHSYAQDGIGSLIPIRSGGVWILLSHILHLSNEKIRRCLLYIGDD